MKKITVAEHNDGSVSCLYRWAYDLDLSDLHKMRMIVVEDSKIEQIQKASRDEVENILRDLLANN